MFWWKKKDTAPACTLPAASALADKQAACAHDGRFTFHGQNRVPYGTCDDCGAEVRADIIMNTYLAKIHALLDERGIR